ncbi:MAG: dipeptidase, partial [Burkholderiales bacterium]
SARAVTDVSRNVPDDILRLVTKNGGIVMVTFVPGFVSEQASAWDRARTAEATRLETESADDVSAVEAKLAAWIRANPAPRATIADVADHVDHIRKIAGIEHIGLGGDFDGISQVVQGLEDVSTYPALTAELLRRGYSDEDIGRINNSNILRVMREAERVAARLQGERAPSSLLFEGQPGR